MSTLSGPSNRERVERLRRVNKICETFEASLRREASPHEQPAIAQFLEQVAEHERRDLFPELLGIELEYRRLHGVDLLAEEYHRRFPDYTALIETGFAEVQTVSQPDPPPPGQQTTADADLRWPTVGGRLGNYRIEKEIGRGGMGVVYLATQVDTARKTALKVIRPDRLIGLTADEKKQAFDRFQIESRAAASLDHDHIVTLYEVGEANGFQYLAMQFVEGQSLRECVQNGPLESLRAAGYLQQAARAVHAMHQQDILHRDLTPQNILISQADDRAMVTDFGLAKLTNSESLTVTGAVFGSPPYMSPEQATDVTRADVRSDVYSLGATLYHALTGRPPFQASSATQTILQVVRDEPLPVRKLNSDVDRDMETVCMKCLEKDPRQRYASAEELAEELARIQRLEPVHARPLGAIGRGCRWCRRNPLPATLLAILFLTLLVGTVTSSTLAVVAHGQTKLANQSAYDFQQKELEARLLAEQSERYAQAAIQQAELAKKSIANQLRLYSRPCKIAGRVATAPDAESATRALRQLGAVESSVMSSSVSLVTDELARLIDADPNQFQEYALDRRQAMPIAQVARRLSLAARDTWIRECNSNYGRSRGASLLNLLPPPTEGPPTTVIELEQELLVEPLLREIKQVVGGLVEAEDWQNAASLRIRFWQLYWGELVLIESDVFAEALTAMGDELASWEHDGPFATPHRRKIANRIRR
jgi:serine/threonine protein kinase